MLNADWLVICLMPTSHACAKGMSALVTVPRLHNIYIWVAGQTPLIFNLMIGVYLAERKEEKKVRLDRVLSHEESRRVTKSHELNRSRCLSWARVWNGHTFIHIFLCRKDGFVESKFDLRRGHVVPARLRT